MTIPHTDSITLVHQPPFSIEVFQSPQIQEPVLITNVLNHLHTVLPVFLEQLKQEVAQSPEMKLCSKLLSCSVWTIELSFINNAEMMSLNHEYRAKTEPTDVLSFGVFSDESSNDLTNPVDMIEMIDQLPEVTLGNIFVSIPYALEHCEAENIAAEHYLLERILHGCLHLSGLHHDTMAEFERVKRIQNASLMLLQS